MIIYYTIKAFQMHDLPGPLSIVVLSLCSLPELLNQALTENQGPQVDGTSDSHVKGSSARPGPDGCR